MSQGKSAVVLQVWMCSRTAPLESCTRAPEAYPGRQSGNECAPGTGLAVQTSSRMRPLAKIEPEVSERVLMTEISVWPVMDPREAPMVVAPGLIPRAPPPDVRDM